MSQRLPSRVLLPVRILSRSFRRMLLAGCKTPSNRTSSPSSYIRHVMSSAPAEASLFNSKNARRNASTVTWWRSAVRRSRGSRCTNCRIRSAACDALPRHCVRRALWHRWSRPVPCRTACLGRGRRGPADGATTRAREGDQDAQGDAVVLAETPWAAEARREAASGGARSLRRRNRADDAEQGATGAQPTVLGHGWVVITFDELPEQLGGVLEAAGCRFTDESDTEVPLHLFISTIATILRLSSKRWAVSHSRFGTAAHHGGLLARDGFGRKPPSCSDTRSTLRFASESEGASDRWWHRPCSRRRLVLLGR